MKLHPSTNNATYRISFTAAEKTACKNLPPPDTSYAPQGASDVFDPNTSPPPAPFKTLAAATSLETDLAPDYDKFLLTGATGLPNFTVDTRVKNANNLANGVYQLTGASLPHDAFTGDMVHRFHQMWQQFDCDKANVSAQHPNGCLFDLVPYVEVTTGSSSPTGKTLACLKSSAPPASYLCTGEGSNGMSFYKTGMISRPWPAVACRVLSFWASRPPARPEAPPAPGEDSTAGQDAW